MKSVFSVGTQYGASDKPENLHEAKEIDRYPMYIFLTKFHKNRARFGFNYERNPFFSLDPNVIPPYCKVCKRLRQDRANFFLRRNSVRQLSISRS